MKKVIIIATAIVFVISMMGTVFAADMKLLKWTANTDMAKFGHDKAIVKTVKAQNKKGMSLNKIKDTDRVWRDLLTGTIAIMDDMMTNNCAKAAQAILESRPYIMEVFVMDNQGANVCMTDKTGDYWQGDEAKFVKSYNGGIGSVFVDEEFEEDEATRAMVGQVSVPVMNKGMAIGAMTIGVYVDEL